MDGGDRSRWEGASGGTCRGETSLDAAMGHYIKQSLHPSLCDHGIPTQLRSTELQSCPYVVSAELAVTVPVEETPQEAILLLKAIYI